MSIRPIIQFDSVTFQYDSQAEPNLKDISFEIEPGEMVLIIGPSGSGKSTIAKCINGQIPNTFPGNLQGNITINGVDPWSASLFDLSLTVGTVLQDTDGQFVGMTVAEDLAFALENDQVPQETMIKMVEEWSRVLSLDDLLTQKPHNLSGGQKQRVSIGGVMVNEVPILLFDEPLANLDPASGLKTMELINRLHHELGVTVIVIEHRLEEVLVADIDRVLVLNDGELVANTSADSLLRSEVIDEVGLRQPLYLAALMEAGVDRSRLPVLDQYQKIQLDASVLTEVEEWAKGIVRVESELEQTTVLEVDSLGFAYPHQTTPGLSDINFTINRGDMVSIVGSNGAGKTTLAKLISGFIQPNSGVIRIDGQDNKELSIKEIADLVGYVMQNPNNMISQTLIFDEVALGLRNRGVDEELIQERVFETLRICGLYSMRNWPISALSYGQKRRVTIASILVLEPQILILDEPTAGQDYTNYSQFMSFITKLNYEHNQTIIMITHDMHLMQEYTQRTLVFSGGRLLADTTPAQIFNRPDLLASADLVPTSLYYLGQDLPTLDSGQFLESFMSQERRGLQNE